MRLLLRGASLTLATGLVLFCCSCERHHVGELPSHGHADGTDKHAAGAHESSSSESRGTPANFFPDKPKP